MGKKKGAEAAKKKTETEAETMQLMQHPLSTASNFSKRKFQCYWKQNTIVNILLANRADHSPTEQPVA